MNGNDKPAFDAGQIARLDAAFAVVRAVGVPEEKAVEEADRRQHLVRGVAAGLHRSRAFLLVAPLLLFLAVTYLLPIGGILARSVDDSALQTWMPKTAAALAQWDGDGLPDNDTLAIFAAELGQARKAHTIGRVANHLNYRMSGMRSLFNKTGRRLAAGGGPQDGGNWREWLVELDPRWGRRQVWMTIKAASGRYTSANYLASLDLRRGDDGGVTRQPEGKRIYLKIFLRTLWVSLAVTVFCLLLGFPVAHLMAGLPPRLSNWLMIMVLLPFWTSLLVRTTSWIALLQSNGVINGTLVWLGLIGDDERIQMVFNLTGTVVAMTYVLLPFMVLPLYSVMRGIPRSLTRVAVSLGATPLTAFARVYLPQTLVGVGAGSLLVFMLAVGYYITPALVGGQSGQLISNFIFYHIKVSLNWGFASALGVILLAAVLLVYWVYHRLVGIEKMRVA